MKDWYDHRDELEPGMIVINYQGSRLRLDHRVPGDGTNWVCDVWYSRPDHENGGYWCADECHIHPSDIIEVEGENA